MLFMVGSIEVEVELFVTAVEGVRCPGLLLTMDSLRALIWSAKVLSEEAVAVLNDRM